MFPSFPYGKHRETLFPVSVLIFKMQSILRYAAGNFNENPTMRALAKILRARASEHFLIFASDSSEGQILRARSNWMGPFNIPKASFCQHRSIANYFF